MARPSSAEIPDNPSLAMTEVKPAKIIEIKAYRIHVFINLIEMGYRWINTLLSTNRICRTAFSLNG